MKFEDILKEQIKIHPSMEPQDFMKLCFQASFGGEHLLSDLESARKYFDSEYENIPAKEGFLYEQISEDISRINLRTWKNNNLP